MRAPFVLLIASVVVSAVAGCTASPTGVEARPHGAAFSTSSGGGLGFGSGNRSETDTTTAMEGTTADEGGETEAEGRGGLVFGSGN